MMIRVLASVIVLFMAAGGEAFCQEMIYQRIAVPIHQFEQAKEILTTDHFYVQNGEAILEVSDRIRRILDEKKVAYDVLVSDLTAHYQQQNRIESSRSRLPEISSVKTPEHFRLGSMGGYLTLSEMTEELTEMHKQYPDLITKPEPIGEFKTHENRSILQVRISGKKGSSDQKKGVLYTALHHAREPLSMQQLIYFMWYLLENYGSDPLVTDIMDQTRFYFIPCVNPDGYAYNNQVAPDGGGMWRGNRQLDESEMGVDLNRNYGYQWGYDNSGSSDDPGSDIFRGKAPFSEPETQAVKWFCENYDVSLALNYHSFGDYLIYPWGYTDASTADEAGFNALARGMSYEKRIAYGNSVETVLYPTNGDTDDWMYGEESTKKRIFSFTPEVGPVVFGFYPPKNQIESLCAREVDQNIRLALAAHQFVHVVHSYEPVIADRTFDHRFYLYPLSFSDVAAQVEIRPVSDNIKNAQSSFFFVGHQDNEEHSVKIELKENIQSGEEVVFVMKTDNGRFARDDTIRYIYNPSAVKTIVLDESLLADEWTGTSSTGNGWGVSRTVYYSGTGSVTDSPQGRYIPGSENIIVSKSSYLIPDDDAVFLTYHARWNITHGQDFAQLSISTDGQHFEPLRGRWTTDRYDTNIEKYPVYTGVQEEWITETISLRDYAGEEVYFKWEMISESSDGQEGIFIDDMAIVHSSVLTSSDQDIGEGEFKIYPNPVVDRWITIDLDERKTMQKWTRFEIRDLLGRVVSTGSLSGKSTGISLPHLSSGAYLVIVTTESGYTLPPQKFIITN